MNRSPPSPPISHPATAPGDPTRQALTRAADAVARVGRDDIFEVLVLGAADALGVDLSFIGVLADSEREIIESIAVCDGGRLQSNFEYALTGTPCQDVVGRRFHYHPDGVQDIFSDPHLKEVGAVGYAAIELERRNVDEARRHSEESYRSIFEATEDALFVHDVDTGAILDVNSKACQVYGYTAQEMREADIGMLSSGIPPYTLEHAREHLERAKREGPVRVDWQGRNRDGSLHSGTRSTSRR